MDKSPRQLWYAHLLEEYLTHENIAAMAYEVWEKEGRPDGEQQTPFGCKVKEIHWLHAKMVLELAADFDSHICAAYFNDGPPSKAQ